MKEKILLVEDDELIGSLVTLNLEQEGFEVSWERLGRPALSRTRSENCDLVILDIMLPDEDGVDMVRQLRAMWKQRSRRWISAPTITWQSPLTSRNCSPGRGR